MTAPAAVSTPPLHLGRVAFAGVPVKRAYLCHRAIRMFHDLVMRPSVLALGFGGWCSAQHQVIHLS